MKAECTWGEGPDVLVSLDGTTIVLHEKPVSDVWEHGVVTQGSLDLTAGEAEAFASELLGAAREVRNLEFYAKQHDEAEVDERGLVHVVYKKEGDQS